MTASLTAVAIAAAIGAAYGVVRRRDRIAFGSPVRAITFAHHELSNAVDDAGVAPEGVLCDPTPNASTPGVGYRTSSDYLSGAAPRTICGRVATGRPETSTTGERRELSNRLARRPSAARSSSSTRSGYEPSAGAKS